MSGAGVFLESCCGMAYEFIVYFRRFKAVSFSAPFREKYSNFHIFNDRTLVLTFCLKTFYVKGYFENDVLIG
jgi:hypothetical protein